MGIQSCAEDGEEPGGETRHDDNVRQNAERTETLWPRDFIVDGLNGACSTNIDFRLPCGGAMGTFPRERCGVPADHKHVRLPVARSYHEMGQHEAIFQ